MRFHIETGIDARRLATAFRHRQIDRPRYLRFVVDDYISRTSATSESINTASDSGETGQTYTSKEASP